MGQLLLLAALACGDVRDARMPVVEDRVDVVELNHFYDCEGKPVLDQLIFWDFCRGSERFQVRAWRLWRSETAAHSAAWKGVIIFIDGERLRVIRYVTRRESWTQEDPELIERTVLPTDQRKDLSR